MKALFLLKQHNTYGDYSSTIKSGLLNSATFVANKLESHFNLETKVAVTVDGNTIDKELHAFKPHLCFIEAIWVTPLKFKELVRLHPKVIFIVRVHSKTTFLANEGMALTWLEEYSKIDNVFVSFNNERTNHEYKHILHKDPIYLPNIYDTTIDKTFCHKLDSDIINVGCFGAIRPMKNHLQQAIAALQLGFMEGKIIHFHINAGRVEQKGDNVLKNLRALFKDKRHKLIEHGWLDRPDFLKLVSKMDIGLQISLTESFNIVTADFVKENVPIVVSDEIEWMPKSTRVSNIDTLEISHKMKKLLSKKKKYIKEGHEALFAYNTKALKVWSKFLNRSGKSHESFFFNLLKSIVHCIIN